MFLSLEIANYNLNLFSYSVPCHTSTTEIFTWIDPNANVVSINSFVSHCVILNRISVMTLQVLGNYVNMENNVFK